MGSHRARQPLLNQPAGARDAALRCAAVRRTGVETIVPEKLGACTQATHDGPPCTKPLLQVPLVHMAQALVLLELDTTMVVLRPPQPSMQVLQSPRATASRATVVLVPAGHAVQLADPIVSL